MMEVRFHPEAVVEMISAARQYDRCVTGLGARFLEAVEFAASQIQARPTLGSVDARGGAVGLSGGFLTGSSTGSGRTLSSSSRSGTVVGGRGIGLVGTFELLPMPDISLSDRRSTAVGDVPSDLFWALLNMKEFAFNH